MKLQTLVYFIHIADEGSFTKAAAKCFVSQPALSKAITELEAELGCLLFERRGRSIELTNTGKVAYKQAKEIMHLCDALKEKVDAENKKNYPVKVGYIIFGYMNFFYKKLEKLGDLELIPIYDSTANIRARLMNDELDIALLPCTSEEGLEGVQAHYFYQRHLYILVHHKHPLYSHNTVKFKDLRNVPIIGWDLEDLFQVAQAYENQFVQHEVNPNIVARGKKLGDMTTLMMLHNAVGLCGPVTSSLPEDEYKTIPIIDSDERFGLCAAWKKSNMNPSLQKIISNL